MHRIYKTTTAMVTCLSLIAPQLAVAQDQQTPDPDTQIVLPPDESGEPAPEQTETSTQPAPQPQESAAEDAEQSAELPDAESNQSTEEQPAAESIPSAEQPETEPAAQAPSPKPQVTQAEEPSPKPPVIETAEPPAKPQAPQAEQEVGQGEELPAPKPDTPEAVNTDDPAPAQKPQPDAADPQDTPPAALPETEPAQDVEAGPDEQSATKAQPNEQRADDAQRQAQEAEPAESVPDANEGQPSAVPDAQELERRLQEQAHKAEPDEPEPDQQRAEEGQDTQEVEANPQEQANGQPQPDPEQAAEVQAPEVQARPNAVAQRAAEEVTSTAAAALAADEGEQGQGESSEVKITEDSARSSAEEFATTVAQGLQQTATDQQTQEATRDDDDDTIKDIAKLLLAGAAGMAVGKMLSNDRQVALNTGDRLVVSLPDGSQQVIKDDNTLLYQPGSNVRTETFEDGSSRTTVLRADGSRVVTIRDANMNTLRRTLVRADGTETRLIDDTQAQPVQIANLPAPPPIRINRNQMDETALREALRREAAIDRRFSLGQIRNIPEVRALVAPVNMPGITFETGSAAITPDQAQQLATLGKVIRDSIDQNPREIYMIEGYTDAVGSDAANLALSDQRAESVALALTEYFQVPPENMVVQGYGEQFLLVPTDGPERQNRRVAVRRITGLLAQN
ncbi:OmpA family protein [Paracoccus sp. (in: a-proteobacteria)]|uniref:OmpA family protein n=1 Tax=Paracoccus sp. TaxID=267 RepID=UPI0028AF3E0A|nr:OmpA family protein [Paracoccus sp. (in: a-proteobacteria)]